MINAIYRVRHYKQGPGGNYSLTVPGEIASALPPSIRFTCEMTEEGILYKPVRVSWAEATEAMPEWARDYARG
jgi:hypothetical protein